MVSIDPMHNPKLAGGTSDDNIGNVAGAVKACVNRYLDAWFIDCHRLIVHDFSKVIRYIRNGFYCPHCRGYIFNNASMGKFNISIECIFSIGRIILVFTTFRSWCEQWTHAVMSLAYIVTAYRR